MINRNVATTHKTLDFSKSKTGIQRRLAIFFTDDLDALKRAVAEILTTKHPLAVAGGPAALDASLPPYAPTKTVINTDHGQSASATVSWRNQTEGGDAMDIQVRILVASQLLASATPSVDFIQKDPLHLIYVVEGEPATASAIAMRPPAGRPRSRATMCIASGEHKLFNELKLIMARIYPEQPNVVQMRPLHSGDVAWVQTVTNPATGETYEDVMCNFLVERKDKNDFIATHFRRGDDRSTQLAVMLATVPSSERLFYIIEGDVLDTSSAADPKAKFATAILPAVRDKIRVVSTQSTRATAHFLANMHMYMEYCDEAKLHNKPIVFGNRLLTAPKKADFINNGGRDKFIHILTLVLGVSDDVATAINKVYPTFASLMRAFTGHYPSDDAPFILQDIQVEGGKREHRRIGPALSEAIYKYFEVDNVYGHTTHSPRPQRPAAADDDDDDDDDDVEDVTPEPKAKSGPRVHAPTKKRPGPVFEKAKQAFIHRQKQQNKRSRVDDDDDDDDD